MANTRLVLVILAAACVLALGGLQGACAHNSGTPVAVSGDAASAPGSASGGAEEKAEEMKAAEMEAERRRKRAEDLEARMQFRRELLAKEADAIKAAEEKLRTVQVVYGGVVVVKNTRSSNLLAGTNFRYIHQYGSGQHQIVAVPEEDGYTHWRVMPRSGQRWELVKDVPVANGDVIRLLNMRTDRSLHSHKGPKSPLSGNNEVSNFGDENGSIDPNDNWVVQTDGDATWHMGTHVNILHSPHRAPLLSDSKQGNATMDHDEVYCRMPPANKPETDDSKPFVGEWMAKPVSGGATNVGFDRWVALYENQNPVVSVSDLDYNLVSEGKCLALNLQSPHFEASLQLNCEPNSNNRRRDREREREKEEEKEAEAEEPDEI